MNSYRVRKLSGVNIPVIVHWEYTEGHNLVNSDIKLQEPPQGGTSSDSDQLHAVHHGVCLCLDTGVKGDWPALFPPPISPPSTRVSSSPSSSTTQS